MIPYTNPKKLPHLKFRKKKNRLKISTFKFGLLNRQTLAVFFLVLQIHLVFELQQKTPPINPNWPDNIKFVKFVKIPPRHPSTYNSPCCHWEDFQFWRPLRSLHWCNSYERWWSISNHSSPWSWWVSRFGEMSTASCRVSRWLWWSIWNT